MWMQVFSLVLNSVLVYPWWRHQIKIFSAFCAGNSSVTSEFLAQRQVTRSFDVIFDLHLNKHLSKQPWGWWFETPSHSLWRHCNVIYASKTGSISPSAMCISPQCQRCLSRQCVLITSNIFHVIMWHILYTHDLGVRFDNSLLNRDIFALANVSVCYIKSHSQISRVNLTT